MNKPAEPQAFRPDKLDVRRFARDQASLRGQTPVAEFERLREEAFGLDEAALAHLMVDWEATGIWRELRGGAAETRMHLRVSITLPLQCQLCLEPASHSIEVDRGFLFVSDEATAEKLDETSEDDVLVASKTFDLLSLVEDEILMELPLVPQHDICPVPLALPDDDDLPRAADEDGTNGHDDGADADDTARRPNPFAALKKLH